MGEKERELIEKFGFDLSEFDFSSEAMFKMHLLNIVTGAAMLVVGGILLFKTRKQKNGGGKRIAGWILVGLGAAVTITHTIQMLL